MVATTEHLHSHQFRTKTAVRAEQAAAELEQTNARLAELNEQRNAALLRDDNADAIALGGEIASLTLSARAFEDKITLLRAQDAREAAEKRAKLVEEDHRRTDILFDLRTETAAKLTACLEQATKHWRTINDCNRKIAARHAWTTGDQSATLINSSATSNTVAHEMFRISHVPVVYGGQAEDAHAGQPLPGSRAPSHMLVGQPGKIPRVVDVFREAGEYGKRVLRGQPGVVVNGVPHEVVSEIPETSTNGGGEPVVTGGAKNSPPADRPSFVQRSDAETRLAALLKRQNELAEDTSPQAEQEYQRVVREIARVQAEMEQGHG
jgi:hypothetical protein